MLIKGNQLVDELWMETAKCDGCAPSRGSWGAVAVTQLSKLMLRDRGTHVQALGLLLSGASAPPHPGCSEAQWAPEVEAPAQSSVISIVLDSLRSYGFNTAVVGWGQIRI